MSFWGSFWDLIWWFLWAFAFIAYLFALFAIIGDLFRDRQLNGWWKAVWIIFLIFVPFLTATKEIVGGPSSVRVRYRCDQREAMVNLDWAVTCLSGADPMEHMVNEVRELRRWLGEFPTTSMVELDYWTVASMFSETDLVMDDSAEELRHALNALERGNILSAVRKYHRVAMRWAESLAISSSN
jgi:hypothetical protein